MCVFMHVCVFRTACFVFVYSVLSLLCLAQVSIPDKEPQKLCGVKSPGLMPTNSYTVQLDYHTDWAGLSQGWSLHYTTQSERGRKKCIERENRGRGK